MQANRTNMCVNLWISLCDSGPATESR
jgi:hypothetical protein